MISPKLTSLSAFPLVQNSKETGMLSRPDTYGGNKGDCLPLVTASVPLKAPVRVYSFLIGCPLPRRKKPWCPCPFRNRSIQAWLFNTGLRTTRREIVTGPKVLNRHLAKDSLRSKMVWNNSHQQDSWMWETIHEWFLGLLGVGVRSHAAGKIWMQLVPAVNSLNADGFDVLEYREMF